MPLPGNIAFALLLMGATEGLSVSDRNRDRIVIDGGERAGLRRYAAKDREGLRRAGARGRDRVRANRLSPVHGPAGVAEQGIIDECRAGGLHLASRHREAIHALVEPDIVRRGVGAGDGDGARLIDIGGEHALGAEIQVAGAIQRTGRRDRDLDVERSCHRRRFRAASRERAKRH
jgi:hypothetical protein